MLRGKHNLRDWLLRGLRADVRFGEGAAEAKAPRSEPRFTLDGESFGGQVYLPGQAGVHEVPTPPRDLPPPGIEEHRREGLKRFRDKRAGKGGGETLLRWRE